MNKKKTVAAIFFGLILPGLCYIANGQSLSAEVAKRIIDEVDSEFTIMVKAAETLDINILYSGVDDRLKAGFITNGNYFSDFSRLMEDFKSKLGGISGQKIVLEKKKITPLSEHFALLTATGESTVSLSSGSPFSNRFFWSFVYEKIGNNWKVIQSHQSGER